MRGRTYAERLRIHRIAMECRKRTEKRAEPPLEIQTTSQFKRLAAMFQVLTAIEGKASSTPLEHDIARSVVHSELRRLEAEMGVGLDEIAGGKHA